VKIDRLFSELVYFMNRDVVTAREIADHLEVSVRMAKRDMDTLSFPFSPLHHRFVGDKKSFILGQAYETMLNPPLTLTVWPVICLDTSDDRKTHILARSIGSPKRRIG